MAKQHRVSLILPNAAAWVFGVSEARMRRLALDGVLPYRTVRGIGRPCRGYLLDALHERWEADPDRLGMLHIFDTLHVRSRGAVNCEIYAAPPRVDYHEDDFP